MSSPRSTSSGCLLRERCAITGELDNSQSSEGPRRRAASRDRGNPYLFRLGDRLWPSEVADGHLRVEEVEQDLEGSPPRATAALGREPAQRGLRAQRAGALNENEW